MRENNNVWDSIDQARNNHEINKTNGGSRRNKTVFEKSIPLPFKILSCVLIAAILIFLAYFFLVHPVSKLTWRLEMARNCRMSITLKKDSFENTVTMDIDDNYFCLLSVGWGNRYFEIRGDELYEYNKYGTNAGEFTLAVESISEDGVKGAEALFEKDNYERVDGKWFTWKIKDGINTGDFRNVRITQRFGHFIIEGKVRMDKTVYDVEIVISRIGTAKVAVPWEN